MHPAKFGSSACSSPHEAPRRNSEGGFRASGFARDPHSCPSLSRKCAKADATEGSVGAWKSRLCRPQGSWEPRNGLRPREWPFSSTGRRLTLPSASPAWAGGPGMRAPRRARAGSRSLPLANAIALSACLPSGEREGGAAGADLELSAASRALQSAFWRRPRCLLPSASLPPPFPRALPNPGAGEPGQSEGWTTGTRLIWTVSQGARPLRTGWMGWEAGARVNHGWECGCHLPKAAWRCRRCCRALPGPVRPDLLPVRAGCAPSLTWIPRVPAPGSA